MDNDINKVYQLPLEIDSEITLKFGTPLTIIILIGVMFLFSSKTENMVYAPFKYAWYVWNMLIGFVLAFTSGSNKKKRIAHSLIFYLTRYNGVYKSIDNPRKYEEMKVSVKDETPDNEYNC